MAGEKIESFLSLFDVKEEWNDIYKKSVYFENELYTNKILLSLIQEAVRAYIEGEKFEIKISKVDEKEKVRFIKSITSLPPKFLKRYIMRDRLSKRELIIYKNFYPFCEEKKCTFSTLSNGYAVFYPTTVKLFLPSTVFSFTTNVIYDNMLFFGSIKEKNMVYLIVSQSRKETDLILFSGDKEKVIPLDYAPYSVCGSNDFLFLFFGHDIHRLDINSGRDDIIFSSHELDNSSKLFIFPDSKRFYVSDSGYIYVFLITEKYNLKYVKKIQESVHGQTATCIVELENDKIAISATGRANVYIWNIFSSGRENPLISTIKGVSGSQSSVCKYSDHYFAVVNKYGVNFYSSSNYRLVQNLSFVMTSVSQEVYSITRSPARKGQNESIIISSKNNFFIVE